MIISLLRILNFIGFAFKTAQTLHIERQLIRQLCQLSVQLITVVRRDDRRSVRRWPENAVEDWSIANHCISYKSAGGVVQRDQRAAGTVS